MSFMVLHSDPTTCIAENGIMGENGEAQRIYQSFQRFIRESDNSQVDKLVIVHIQELETQTKFILWHSHILCELADLMSIKLIYVCNSCNYVNYSKTIDHPNCEVIVYPHRFGAFEVNAHTMYNDRPQDVSWNPASQDIIYMTGKNLNPQRVFPVVAMCESDLSERFKYSFFRQPQPIPPDQTELLTEVSNHFTHEFDLPPECHDHITFYDRYHSELDVSESHIVIDADNPFIRDNDYCEKDRGYQHYTGRPIRDTHIYNSGRLFIISETQLFGVTQSHGDTIDRSEPGYPGPYPRDLHWQTGWYTEKTYRHINMGLPVIHVNRPYFWRHMVQDGFRDLSVFYGDSYQEFCELTVNCHWEKFMWTQHMADLFVESIKTFDSRVETHSDEISDVLNHNRTRLQSGILWRDLDHKLGVGCHEIIDLMHRYKNHTWLPELQPYDETHYQSESVSWDSRPQKILQSRV